MSIADRHIELPDADVIPFMRKVPLARRLAMVGEMWESARRRIECNLRQLNPNWSEAEINQETLRRMSRDGQ